MALQNTYQTYFQNDVGDTYRLRLYDLDYTAGADMTSLYGEPQANLPIELTTKFEGITLKYDGDTELLAKPIIGSTLDVELLLTNSTDRRIIDVIKERPEHTVGVTLFRHNGTATDPATASGWDIMWMGVLNHESVTYAFSDLPLELNITFSDGLALLRDQPYLDADGDEWFGGLTSASASSRHAPLRIQIGRCLSRLPHLALWSDGMEFFTEQLDVFHWNHIDDTDSNRIGSILDKSGCDQFTWYDERTPDGPWYRESRLLTQGSSCYQILEDIMLAFGASMFMFDGMFNVVSPFMQTDSSVENGARKWLSDKRSLLTPTFQYAATSNPTSWEDGTDYPNAIDYSDLDLVKYLISSTRSFMPPLARMFMTHIGAGSHAIFKQTGQLRGHLTGPTDSIVYGDNGEYLTDVLYHFPLDSSEAVVQSEAELRLKFKIEVSSFTQDVASRLGRQPYLKMKIKVGNQYLKQNITLDSTLTADSDFGNIRVAAGSNAVPSGIDITTWEPLIISDDVEWTSVDSFFYMPLLIPSIIEGGWEVIEYQDGDTVTEYPVGLNTRRDANHPNQMRHTNTMSFDAIALNIDMQLPALPTSASDFEGVYCDIQIESYDNTGTLATHPNSATTNTIHAVVRNFKFLNGDDDYEGDALHFSEATGAAATTETVEIGQTLLGTRTNDQKIVGALHVGDGHRTNNLESDPYGENWFSESGETFPTSSTGRGILPVTTSNHFSSRITTLNTFQMELLLRDIHSKLIYPQSRIIINTGTTDTTIQVQSVEHNLVAGTQTIEGYEVDRVFTGQTTGSTTLPAGFADNTTKGPNILVDGFNIVRDNQVGGSGSGLTQEQIDKLAAILIDANGDITDFTVASGSDPLDVTEVSGAASTTTVSSLQSRVQDIEKVTDNVTIDQSNNITQITTNASAIAANSILESPSKQFVTGAEATQITTNQTNISNLDTTVNAIVTVVKDTAGGGGKGVYNDTTAGVTESYVGMTDTTLRVQAGAGNTGIDLSETSPGTIDMEVQAGATGSEAAFTAIEIAGDASSVTATTTVNGSLVVVGDFSVDSGAVAGASLKLEEADLLGSNYIEIKAPISVTANTTLTLPDGAGSNGQVLQTNGSGTLTWTDRVSQVNPLVKGALTIERITTGNTPKLYIKGEDNLAGVILQAPETISTDVTYTLPGTDGTSGQVLQTDGSGNLSFVTAGGSGTPTILGNISGRYMWSSTDSGERVHTGNFSYGPFNWYSFTSEPSSSTFRAYSASDTVGTTTTSLAASHLLAYGFNVPTTDKKVKIHYAFRLQNAPASSTWGMSLWGADRQASGSTSSSTATLRAETADITQSSNSSSRVFHGTMETASDFAEDVAVLMMEHRSGTLTTTTYMYANFQIELVD